MRVRNSDLRREEGIELGKSERKIETPLFFFKKINPPNIYHVIMKSRLLLCQISRHKALHWKFGLFIIFMKTYGGSTSGKFLE